MCLVFLGNFLEEIFKQICMLHFLFNTWFMQIDLFNGIASHFLCGKGNTKYLMTRMMQIKMLVPLFSINNDISKDFLIDKSIIKSSDNLFSLNHLGTHLFTDFAKKTFMVCFFFWRLYEIQWNSLYNDYRRGPLCPAVSDIIEPSNPTYSLHHLKHEMCWEKELHHAKG